MRQTAILHYLQAKVETLDLFATAWGIIESPAKTFKRIVLARRKNYVFLLSMVMGIELTVTAVAYQNLGPAMGSLAALAAVLVLGGGALGIVGVPGARTTFRAVMAVIVYANVPVVSILLAVIPTQLAIFGGYLFDHNPSPMVIAPGLFITLAVLEGVGALWSLMLMVVGMRVATSLRGFRPALLALVTGLLGSAMMWALRLVRLS